MLLMRARFDNPSSLGLEIEDQLGGAEDGAGLGNLGQRLCHGNITLREIGREPPLTRASRMMGPADLDRASEEGRHLTLDQAVSIALEEAPAHEHT